MFVNNNESIRHMQNIDSYLVFTFIYYENVQWEFSQTLFKHLYYVRDYSEKLVARRKCYARHVYLTSTLPRMA